MKQLTKDSFPKYTSSSYNSMPKKQTIQSKSGEKTQTFLQRRHKDGQQTHEKMLNIAHC